MGTGPDGAKDPYSQEEAAWRLGPLVVLGVAYASGLSPLLTISDFVTLRKFLILCLSYKDRLVK